MGLRVTALVLLLLAIVAPATAQKKHKGRVNWESLRPHPESVGQTLHNTGVVDLKKGIMVYADVSVQDDLGYAAVSLSVYNLRKKPQSVEDNGSDWVDAMFSSVEVAPEKVFLEDARSKVHVAMPDYVLKSIYAEAHRLPPFAPPPPRVYYTVAETPVGTTPAGPLEVYAIQVIGTGYLLYGTQPQITTYERPVREHADYSNVLGYEIGYALGAWLNKRDLRKDIKLIDETSLHYRRLAPGEHEVGFLFFTEFSPQSESRPKDTANADERERVWVHEEVALAEGRTHNPQLEDSVKLVVFIDDQQFVFRFGPEVQEK
jgi:hypothetical protein